MELVRLSPAQFHPTRVADRPFGCLRIELHHHFLPSVDWPHVHLAVVQPDSAAAIHSTGLEALAVSVARPAGPRETAAESGARAGKIINHYKMSKHFSLTISDGHLA